MSEKTLKKDDLRAWIARMRDRDEWPDTDLGLMQAIEDVLDSHDELERQMNLDGRKMLDDLANEAQDMGIY